MTFTTLLIVAALAWIFWPRTTAPTPLPIPAFVQAPPSPPAPPLPPAIAAAAAARSDRQSLADLRRRLAAEEKLTDALKAAFDAIAAALPE